MSFSFKLSAPLDTLTNEELADRLGKEKANAKRAAELVKETELEILRRAAKEASGEFYRFVRIDETTREGFDAKKARSFLSPSQIAECTTIVDVKASVRIYGA